MSTSVQIQSPAHSPVHQTPLPTVADLQFRATTGSPREIRTAPASPLIMANDHGAQRISLKRIAHHSLQLSSSTEDQDCSSQAAKRRRLSTPCVQGAHRDIKLEHRRQSLQALDTRTNEALRSTSLPVSPTDVKGSIEASTSLEHATTSKAGLMSTTSGKHGNRQRIPVVALSNDVAQTILRSLDTQTLLRQQRAKSVPRNLRSTIDQSVREALLSTQRIPSTAAASGSSMLPSASMQERRQSVREKHLALLASQARLVSTGATSINTAVRAEKAFEGAVRLAVQNVNQARVQHSLLPSSSVKSEEELQLEVGVDGDRAAVGQHGNGPQRYSGPRLSEQDPTLRWSEALADRESAISFLDSAKEVARGWANGFYAYEQEWVGDALMRERRKLSVTQTEDAQKADRISEDSANTSFTLPYALTKKDESHVSRSSSPTSSVERTDKETLSDVQRKLSTGLPLAVVAVAKTTDRTGPSTAKDVGGGSGKLVDVLSNFATLIDSRKEGCHSLELLAQNARRLSAVQLPVVRNEGLDTDGAAAAASASSTIPASASDAVSVITTSSMDTSMESEMTNEQPLTSPSRTSTHADPLAPEAATN